jgi:hypothetical protein
MAERTLTDPPGMTGDELLNYWKGEVVALQKALCKMDQSSRATIEQLAARVDRQERELALTQVFQTDEDVRRALRCIEDAAERVEEALRRIGGMRAVASYLVKQEQAELLNLAGRLKELL